MNLKDKWKELPLYIFIILLGGVLFLEVINGADRLIELLAGVIGMIV